MRGTGAAFGTAGVIAGELGREAPGAGTDGFFVGLMAGGDVPMGRGATTPAGRTTAGDTTAFAPPGWGVLPPGALGAAGGFGWAGGSLSGGLMKERETGIARETTSARAS
jgi:hypothetical protein